MHPIKFTLLFITLMLLDVQHAVAQDSLLLKESIQKWKNACEYTLELATAMPSENYDFRPVKRMRSFSEQLAHIGKNMVWLSSKFTVGEKFEHPLAQKENCTPEETIQLFKASCEFAQKALEKQSPNSLNTKVDFFAGPMTIRQIINLMHDHHTHHRGQLIVYLNLKDIEPPKYRGW